MAEKRHASKAPNLDKLVAAAADLDDAPQIVVECANPQCEQYTVQVSTPAGVVLAHGVLFSGNLNCMNCGMVMSPVSGT